MTKVNKLVALQLLPADMPDAEWPVGDQMGLMFSSSVDDHE